MFMHSIIKRCDRAFCALPSAASSRTARSKRHHIVCAAHRSSGSGTPVSRRFALAGAAWLALFTTSSRQQASAAVQAPTIQLGLTPDQSKYDPADPDLREAAALLQEALKADDVVKEEQLWTKIIDTYGSSKANWVPDVVGRAYGNRGNARSRQGKLEAAMADYGESIRICPWSVDPVLNRGVALESLGRFEEAVADYKAVLAVAPADPAAWNNLGNATAGLGRYEEAAEYYGRAVAIAPSFSFASANRALAMYQAGKENEGIREMRTLLRRYPDFDDMRAALAAALWAGGKEGDAETNWDRVDDARYRDRTWLRNNRRWPPKLVRALEALLDVRSVPSAAAA